MCRIIKSNSQPTVCNELLTCRHRVDQQAIACELSNLQYSFVKSYVLETQYIQLTKVWQAES